MFLLASEEKTNTKYYTSWQKTGSWACQKVQWIDYIGSQCNQTEPVESDLGGRYITPRLCVATINIANKALQKFLIFHRMYDSLSYVLIP